MPEYSAKLNLEKPLGTENVNRAFFTRLIDDIDSKAGSPNGLARLDQNGNVLKADGSLAGEVTAAQFTEHKEERSSVQKAGHVQLSDAISSTDTTKAATSNAVKKAYDRADQAFLSASNGKNLLTNAITGTDSRVVIPPDPSFGQLATAVRQIQTGKKWAQGTATLSSITSSFYDGMWDEYRNMLTTEVFGLTFTPSLIYIQMQESSDFAYIYDKNRNDPLYKIISVEGMRLGSKYRLENGAYVNSQGFKLPISRYAGTYKWTAIE